MASPLIWTTIATGRTPVDHGVADFQELDPKTRARLPISGRSRQVPAIWNLASAKGMTVGVVGWWATWPAEKVNGFFVSDRAAPVLFDPEALSKSACPHLAGRRSPTASASSGRREGTPAYEDVSQALRVSTARSSTTSVAERKDLADPITGYRKILGVTRAYGRIALDLYDREGPQLLMVYFQGTDEIGHVLGRYPSRRSCRRSPRRTSGKYKGGVVGALRQRPDRHPGRAGLQAPQKDGATLLLVSDHGFK